MANNESTSTLDPTNYRPDSRLLAVLGWSGVCLALVLSIAIVGTTAGNDMTILGDEWHYAYWMSTAGALEQGLDPAKGRYAIPLPFLLYQALFETFGVDSFVPFRIAMLVFLALVVGFAYELMRRRVGYMMALPPAALIALFGSAGEVVVNSFRMPGLISLAAALAALLVLERRSTLRDVAAGILLVAAVASHPLGLAFVVAIAILRTPAFIEGRARVATVAMVGAPLLAFLVVLRPQTENDGSAISHLGAVPGFLIEGLQGVFSALGGLTARSLMPGGGLEGFDSPLGLAAAIVVVLAGGWVLWTRRGDATFAVALLAAAIVILAAPVFAPGERPPNLGRYVFPAGTCVLLVLADLARGMPSFLARREASSLAVGTALLIIAASSLVGNTLELKEAAEKYARDARHVRAQAAALEAVRDQGPIPGLKIERHKETLGEKYRFSIEVAEYYTVSDTYGTSAWTPRELAEQDEEVQRTAKLARLIALGKLP